MTDEDHDVDGRRLDHFLRAEIRYAGSESITAFVLRHGARMIGAPTPAKVRRGRPRKCYYNSYGLMDVDPERFVYVEGYAYSGISAVQHAWCLDRLNDCRVVDKTWRQPEQCSYFGVPFTSDFVRRIIVQSGFYGVFGAWDIAYPILKSDQINWLEVDVVHILDNQVMEGLLYCISPAGHSAGLHEQR